MAFYSQTYVKVSYSGETLGPKHAFPNLIFFFGIANIKL